MTPAQLELHRQIYAKDPGYNILQSLMEGMVDHGEALGWHRRYKDFSVNHFSDKASQWESYHNTIRTVICRVRTIANGEIGMRRAMVSQFRAKDDQGVLQEHFSVRLELLDKDENLVRCQRFAFRFEPRWVGHQDQCHDAAKTVLSVEEGMKHFIMTGGIVNPPEMHGHLERLL